MYQNNCRNRSDLNTLQTNLEPNKIIWRDRTLSRWRRTSKALSYNWFPPSNGATESWTSASEYDGHLTSKAAVYRKNSRIEKTAGKKNSVILDGSINPLIKCAVWLLGKYLLTCLNKKRLRLIQNKSMSPTQVTHATHLSVSFAYIRYSCLWLGQR